MTRNLGSMIGMRAPMGLAVGMGLLMMAAPACTDSTPAPDATTDADTDADADAWADSRGDAGDPGHGPSPDIWIPEPGLCGTTVCPVCAHCEEGVCVANPGESDCSGCDVQVDRRALRATGRAAMDLEVVGGTLYAAAATGLEVWDLNTDTLWPTATQPTLDAGLALSRSGGDLAMAHGRATSLYDLEDPLAPAYIGAVPALGWATGVAIQDGTLFIAEGAPSLRYIDLSAVSGPANPGATASIALPGPALTLHADPDGQRLWVAMGADGVALIDLSTGPPTLAGQFTPGYWIARVTANATHLFVVLGTNGMGILDLSKPWNDPSAFARLNFSSENITDIALDADGDRAYLTSGYKAGVRTIDISDPSAPTALAEADFVNKINTLAFWKGDIISAGITLTHIGIDDAGAFSELGTYGNGMPLTISAIARTGDLAIVSSAEGSLTIIDMDPNLSAPTALGVLGVLEDVGSATALLAGPGWVALATRGYAGSASFGILSFIDTTDPTDPFVRSTYPENLPTIVQMTLGPDGHIYLAASDLIIVDISDIDAPMRLSTTSTSKSTRALDFDATTGRLVTFGPYKQVRVFDIADPTAPEQTEIWEDEIYYSHVAADAGHIALSHSAVLADASVHIFTESGDLVAAVELTTAARALSWRDDRLIIADEAWLRIFDTTDPSAPVLVAQTPINQGDNVVSAVTADGAVAFGTSAAPVLEVALSCLPIPFPEVPRAAVDVPATGTDLRLVNLVPKSAGYTVDFDAQPLSPFLGATQAQSHAMPGSGAGLLTLTPLDAGTGSGEPVLSAPLLSDHAATLVAVANSGDGQRTLLSLPGPTFDPGPDHFALRTLNALSWAAPAELKITVAGHIHDMSVPRLGDRSGWTLIPSGQPVSITARAGGRTLVLDLPSDLRAHPPRSLDLMVAHVSPSDLFVLALADDGRSWQLGSASRNSLLRLVNLLDEDAEPRLDDRAAALPNRVASGHSTGPVTTGSGHRKAAFWSLDATGASVSLGATDIWVADGHQTTALAWRDTDGTPRWTLAQDLDPIPPNGDETQIQVFHAAPNLGPVSVALVIKDTFWEPPTGNGFTVVTDLAPGETAKSPLIPASSYWARLTDAFGTVSLFPVGHLPEYVNAIYISRDAAGRLRLGTQSAPNEYISWQYADGETARVRPVNLSGRNDLRAVVPVWFAGVKPQKLSPVASLSHNRVLAGVQTVSMIDSEDTVQAEWTGTLVPTEWSTLAFHDMDGDGVLTSLHLVDRPPGGVRYRVVNLAPEYGAISAQWLGDWAVTTLATNLAPGTAGDAIALSTTTQARGTIQLDTDGDGAWDLTFQVPTGTVDGMVTTFYLMPPDAALGPWPTLRMHALSNQLTPIPPEEAIARLRVVSTVPTTGWVKLALTEFDFETLKIRQGWGETKAATFGQTARAAVPTGATTLRATLGDITVSLPMDLEAGHHYTAHFYGTVDDPQLELLEDGIDPQGAEHAIQIHHVAPGAGPQSVFSRMEQDSADLLLIDGLDHGAVSAWIPLNDGPKYVTLDSDDDGTPDWLVFNIQPQGRARGFIIPNGDATILFLPSEGGWAFIQAEAIE